MTTEQRELIESFRYTPTTLRALLRSVPDETLSGTGEGEDAWSIVEILCHLRDAEQRAFSRVRRMRDEDNPFLEAYDQAALAVESRYREQSLDDALAEFTRIRNANADALSSLGEADWDRGGTHEEQGPITIQSLVAHMAAHDSAHLAQIARRVLGE